MQDMILIILTPKTYTFKIQLALIIMTNKIIHTQF